MNTTGKRIIQKILAIILILTLTMADFLIVGENLVSYAANAIEVNNKNVTFNAYFNEEEKSLEVTKTTDTKDLKLAIELNVENDGYLIDGKLELEEGANFKFKTVNQNSHISKIEENAIYLNQVNESDNVKIEVGVEFANREEIDLDYLSKVSVLHLTGTYINSKNVEKNKSIAIEGKASLKINWKSLEELKSILEAKLLTNSQFSIDEKNKHIVQILVTSNLENNSYPVKNTNIEVELSNTVQNVTVHKRTTEATNGNKEFNENNYTYNDGKLVINIENNQDNRISWKKDAVDEFVITMEYPEIVAQETEITESLRQITVNSTITTYDEKELTNTAKVEVQKEAEGAITAKSAKYVSEVLKGKIYAGEEKTYKTTTEVYIDYAKGIKEIEIKDQESKLVSDEEEKESNIEITKTTINKNEFIALFGEEGTLNIQDQEENTIEIISNEAETDEQGNISIIYSEGTTGLKITTSKPVSEGILRIENEKKILKTELEREEVSKLTGIKESNKVIYTKNDDKSVEQENSATIKLKETETKADLQVQQSTISTSQEQELNIAVDLETNNEERDLYKNPEIKLTFPKQIKSLKAQGKLLYGNGLNIAEGTTKISKENDRYTITAKLEGEQTKYPGEAVKGTRLLINAKVELDKLATNSEEEIKLDYTNENATKYADNGVQKVKLNIVSENPVILTNNIAEYKVSTIGNQGEREVEIQAKSEAKKATVDMKIINNEESEISDVLITGKIASTKGIERASKIKVSEEEAKVYYTAQENPTSDLQDSTNTWTEENIKDAKNYLVVLNNVKNAEKVNISYDISIAKNLGYNITTETGYELTYKNATTNAERNAASTMLKLSTGKVAEVNLEAKAEVGENELKNGDEVKAGEIIKYTVRLSNTGKEKAENISLTATIPENTTLIEVNPKYKEDQSQMIEGEDPEYIIEKQERQIKKENIEIGAEENKIFTYKVRVNKDISETKNAKTEIIVKEGNKEVKAENIELKVTNSSIVAELQPILRSGEDEIRAGYNYIYLLKISNLSDKEQKDIKVLINKNKLINIENLNYVSGENYKELDKNASELTIDSISAKGEATIEIDTLIQQVSENIEKAEISMLVKDAEGNQYRTNKLSERVVGPKLEAYLESSQSAKTEKGYLHPGDEIKYTINLKNTGNIDIENLSIEDQFSDYLQLKSLKINGKDTEYTKKEEFEDKKYNTIIAKASLKVGEQLKVQIDAVVDEDISSEEIIKVANKALIYDGDILLAETTENVTYIESMPKLIENASDDIEANNEKQEVEAINEQNNNEQNNNEQNNVEEQVNQVSYVVSGTVWEDFNENGSRDSGENLIEGMKVYAVNVANNQIAKDINGKEIIGTTNTEGFYTLENLQKGQYIIAFEYDTEKYIPTLYQAEGIKTDINSDAVRATGTVNGERKTVAITDSMDLNESKANIDLGLAQAKVFDLNLEKVVSKMTVTNSSGVKIYEFDDKTLAKTEINSKDINGSTVVVEYKMKITNNGEVAGYASKIVDYVPASLQFNSSLNKGWYKQGEYLYNTSLSNVKIEPGQTKEITLILTKSVTASNTGLTNNKAEIVSSHNTLGIEDVDKKEQQVANNKVSTKNKDQGSADILISPSTGGTVSYVILTITAIVTICALAYIINKKILIKRIKI